MNLEQAIVQMTGVAKATLEARKANFGWNNLYRYLQDNDHLDTNVVSIEMALIDTFVGKMMVMPFMVVEMSGLNEVTCEEAWDMFYEQYWEEMGDDFFQEVMGYNCAENWIAFNEFGCEMKGGISDNADTMEVAVQYLYHAFADEDEYEEA